MLGILTGWYKEYLLAQRRVQAENRLDLYGNILKDTLDHHLALLTALEEFIAIHEDENTLRSRFTVFAKGLYSGKGGLRAIQVFPPEGKVLVYPRDGNEATLDRNLVDLINDERIEVQKDVQHAIESRSTVISGPYPLRQGGFGFVARKPIYRDENFWGLAVTVIDLESFLGIVGLVPPGGKLLNIALRTQQDPAFWGDNGVFEDHPVRYTIFLADKSWEVAAMPVGGWFKSVQNGLIVFWVTGGLLVLMAAALSFLLMQRQIQLSTLVKERTALLEESQREYQQLYDTNPDSYLVLDVHGSIVHINPAACNQYGYSEEEMHGLTIVDLTIREAATVAETLLEQVLSGAGNLTEWQTRKDGSQFCAEINARRALFKNQPCVFLTVRDISERKQAEKSLAESENRYKTLIASMPAGFAVHEMIYDAMTKPKDYQFLEVNAAFERLTGLKAEELIGRTLKEVLPGTESFWIEMFGKVASTGRSAHFENYSKELGKHYDVVAYAPAENQFAIIISDITDRVEEEKQRLEFQKSLEGRVLEQTEELRVRVDESERLNRAMLNLLDDLNMSNQELEILSKRLTGANKELEAFSYSVSHDLRAPLRGIDGFSMALEEDCSDSLDDKGKEYIARIRRATLQMGSLIDDLLRLSRVSRAELQILPLDLSAMAKEIADQLKRDTPGRVVDVLIHDGLRGEADPRLIHIVLENLFGNAFKFSGLNKDAQVEFGRNTVDGEEVFLICDNGDGFDMQYADKLFAPFQRLHRADEFEGTGIGLSIVKRIIDRHNGRLWAESVKGEGACFYFTLHSAEEGI